MKNSENFKGNYGKTALRLMKYVGGTYKLQFIVVVAAIIISSIANMAGPLFLLYLIDDFITPLIGRQNPDFGNLIQMVFIFGALYYLGVICTYLSNRLMVNIGQGVLKRVRDELFTHMQTLPIGFFDTHSHGEIMSLYTNDTDTLRQMISQSIPQAISSAVTIVTIFIVMLTLSLPLTALVVVIVAVMIFLTKRIGGKSGEYFITQQTDLSTVNGFIEEMFSGQKVIKVFCHEGKAERGFDELNEKLCGSATGANQYANVMMPVMANLGNIHYVDRKSVV